MTPQGRVSVVAEDLVMFDAEPHIMSRVRSLFDSGTKMHTPGKYTHAPIMFKATLAVSRDIVWICDRYPLELDDEARVLVERRANEYDSILQFQATADLDPLFRISDQALQMAIPLRDHQIRFRNMATKVKRMLLADKMGLGKTPAAISLFCEPDQRPGIVVVPTNLKLQWQREFERFLPDAVTHVISKYKRYNLPQADVYLIGYNALAYWQQDFCDLRREWKTIVFDEIQELRHNGTGKYSAAQTIASRIPMRIGLSGTPIFNYGNEIHSVMKVLAPDEFGTEREFTSEWCVDGKVREPAVLNSWLKSRGLMLRRTPEDIGLSFGEHSKHVYTLDADMSKLKEVEDIAKMLAMSILSGSINEAEESAREFDWKLRHATGVAKARPTAEFVKLLIEQGEKVVLVGWHRDVYEVWKTELSAFNPVFYTGSESPKQKDEAVKKFREDDSCKVFVISLRSGIGLDGLQFASSTVVFGELDWSPHVMDQVIGRVDRDGQTKHVQAFYLTIADGADPFMMSVLNIKRSQHAGIVEGKDGEAAILEGGGFSRDRIRDMAKTYLESIGVAPPEAVEEVGLFGEVIQALRRLRVPTNTESEMQEAINRALPQLLPDTQILREVKMSKRSRVDFVVSRGDESVAIECKIEPGKRADVYRQVRRYAQDGDMQSLVLFAPWAGVKGFKVENIPVAVVDYSAASI